MHIKWRLGHLRKSTKSSYSRIYIYIYIVSPRITTRKIISEIWLKIIKGSKKFSRKDSFNTKDGSKGETREQKYMRPKERKEQMA